MKLMKSRIALLTCVLALDLTAGRVSAAPPSSKVVVLGEPLGEGTVNPRLFGNFIELLNDVAPGMWGEMLGDRSFEGVLPLANWCYFDGSPDFCDRDWDHDPSWGYDSESPFNAARSAKLTSAAGTPASLAQSGLSVRKGASYAFSGYFRADHPELAVTVRLKALLPDGSWMILGSAEIPRLSANWEKRSTLVNSRGTTDRAVFELKAEGGGHVWVDKVSLMPGDNIHGWRKDVVETVKELRPTLVRWGGSAVDPGGYRWKDGIGDRDMRAPFINKPWGRRDPNDVGVDEFCQLCEFVGVEPLICLSFSDGPQSAADLVEYCNGDSRSIWGSRRAANGHPLPYHVKYWQVGNEISGSDPTYLGRFEDFVRAMKKADSNALLMASFPSQKLLDRVGRDLAYICPHHYTSDFGACDREFTDLTRMIHNTPGCENIQIAVTEWNISGGDWGLMRGKQMTLETGLLNARYLHVMMRHTDKVKIACRSNMANSFCGAAFETSPSGILKRPSFYIMSLYARRFQPVPLKIKQTQGSLDLFACASEDRKSVTIFAVNQSGEPVQFSLESTGFPAPLHAVGAEVLTDTLDMRQPDVMNHWEAPERIKILAIAPGPNGLSLPAYSAAAIECKAD